MQNNFFPFSRFRKFNVKIPKTEKYEKMIETKQKRKEDKKKQTNMLAGNPGEELLGPQASLRVIPCSHNWGELFCPQASLRVYIHVYIHIISTTI